MKESKEKLRKVKVSKVIDKAIFITKDVIEDIEIIAYLRGKMRMNYINIKEGDTFYVVCTDDEVTDGRIVYEKYICLHDFDSSLCKQKKEIENYERDNKYDI